MSRFESSSFVIAGTPSCWNDGSGSGVEQLAMALSVDATHLLCPSPRGVWTLYPFGAPERAQRLELPRCRGRSELLPLSFSVSARKAILSPKPLPSAETAAVHDGCSLTQLCLWDWDAHSLTPIDFRFDALMPFPRLDLERESLLGASIDAQGRAWFAIESERRARILAPFRRNCRSREVGARERTNAIEGERRAPSSSGVGDELFLLLARADGTRVEAGTVLASGRAGRAFFDEGWGFVRFVETPGTRFALVGRPSGVEDRAFVLAEDGAATPDTSLPSSGVIRILGRWKDSWVLVATTQGGNALVVANPTIRSSIPFAEELVRFELLGEQLVGFSNRGNLQLLWLEAPELGWEELSGSEALHEAQRSWFVSSTDLLPPFVAPVTVLCDETPALFQLELTETGYRGVLCRFG